MILKKLNPRLSLNKAFLKVKPLRSDIELFKRNLITLLNQTDQSQSEEFNKNLVSAFLKDTYYAQAYFINPNDRTDLVIHKGKNASSAIAVMLETKNPSNKAEMPTVENLNVKAFQELVLYYLRERITRKNLEVKHLIISNIYEWFIFDASVFEKAFAQNKELVRMFTDFEEGRLAGKTTDFFYNQIAKPFISQLELEIPFTYFDIRDYEKVIKNSDMKDDNLLISLYKIFSPEHLLKLPFSNDSNTLDRAFYTELLHIIGLVETKDGGKKIIGRKKDAERNAFSLMENAISQLDSLDKLSWLEKVEKFGATRDERLFNIALELVITWINRILFLKLLEGQLISYNKSDDSFAFLNSSRLRNFDDLNTLFFSVLARKPEERTTPVKDAFAKVPYLNSSLFEPSELEQKCLFISQLTEGIIPIHPSSVLKDSNGKRRTGELPLLEYFFEFMGAYDFAGEGAEEIQEDNKTLINASVLGLIFEKMNGYKDGSFFTPGFITMYMCRETIRKAVIQKFNDAKKWNCKALDELYDKIEDRAEANSIVNSLKICDPAVGSGHFLVSALNEIIAVKSELKILSDRNGKRLKEYHVEVANDELIITDEDGALIQYNPKNPESRRIQEALFHEKETIIENCLFGVDINPNSVKICRLRLWIELLKNAYYTEKSNYTQLETLPNIDINIKCGNSLISRYELDADIRKALKKSKWTIDSYRLAVMSYRNAQNKDEKRSMEKLIEIIKKDFESEVSYNDRRVLKLNKLRGELFSQENQPMLFDRTKAEKTTWEKRIKTLLAEIDKLEKELEQIKNNKIYENAFEWRFEFPEVLNHEGDFIGFDVVIGNPPYIRQEEFSDSKPFLASKYEVYHSMADLYSYFIERGIEILKTKGNFSIIVANKWMRANYGKALRNFLKDVGLQSVIDFGDLPVFEEATTYPCIISVLKDVKDDSLTSVNVDSLNFNSLAIYCKENAFNISFDSLGQEGWALVNHKVSSLLTKIRNVGTSLGEYTEGKIFYGIKTGLNEAFVIDEDTKNRLIAEDAKSAEVIKPFLAGKDIKRYGKLETDKYLILFPCGWTKKQINGTMDAWSWLKFTYSAIANHLIQYETAATKRCDKGDYWWELRACDYYSEFESTKIIYPNICKGPEFTYDANSLYTNQKCFIISMDDKYLLGVLNSSITTFFFKYVLPKLRGDFYEPSYVYLKELPIVRADLSVTQQVESLVDQILALKRANHDADTSGLEAEIDRLVYELYGLTDDEIKIVEGEN